MNNKVNHTNMPRGIGAQLTRQQLDELRDFLDELDVIPLSALPSEVWPLVYEYQYQLQNDLIKFDNPIEEDMRIKLNRRLALKRKRRKEIQDETFQLF